MKIVYLVLAFANGSARRFAADLLDATTGASETRSAPATV